MIKSYRWTPVGHSEVTREIVRQLLSQINSEQRLRLWNSLYNLLTPTNQNTFIYLFCSSVILINAISAYLVITSSAVDSRVITCAQCDQYNFNFCTVLYLRKNG